MTIEDILNATVEGQVTIDGMKVKVWRAYQSSDEKRKEDEKKDAQGFIPPVEWLDEESI